MMATIFEPEATGLPVYVVFNCEKEFGWAFQIFRDKNCVNIGIAKDYGGKEPAGRFNWDEVFPVYVSDHPLVIGNGKSIVDTKIEKEFPFSKQEMYEVSNFIKRNQHAIRQHWAGEIDDLELNEKIKD